MNESFHPWVENLGDGWTAHEKSSILQGLQPRLEKPEVYSQSENERRFQAFQYKALVPMLKNAWNHRKDRNLEKNTPYCVVYLEEDIKPEEEKDKGKEEVDCTKGKEEKDKGKEEVDCTKGKGVKCVQVFLAGGILYVINGFSNVTFIFFIKGGRHWIFPQFLFPKFLSDKNTGPKVDKLLGNSWKSAPAPLSLTKEDEEFTISLYKSKPSEDDLQFSAAPRFASVRQDGRQEDARYLRMVMLDLLLFGEIREATVASLGYMMNIRYGVLYRFIRGDRKWKPVMESLESNILRCRVSGQNFSCS